MSIFTAKEEKLTVKTFGNPVLRKESAEIREVTQELRDLAEHMIECMYDENGIGLAAPQIGVNKRMFVIDTNVEDEVYTTPGEAMLAPRMPMALINQIIISTAGTDTPFLEGCLSIPGVNATVFRPEIIQLKAQTLDGEEIDIECGGLLARCAQHEIDHLDGILFTDKAVEEEMIDQQSTLEKLRIKNKKSNAKKKR